MNETSAEYLNGLVEVKNKLSLTLNNKNIEASPDEQLDSLVSKVEKIHNGVELGSWLPTVNTAVFTVENLPFLPYKIGISCEEITGQSLLGEATRFISLFSANGGESLSSIYSGISGEAAMQNIPIGAAVIVTAEENNTYKLSVDFSEWNGVGSVKYLFKGGYDYMWVASAKEWKK